MINKEMINKERIRYTNCSIIIQLNNNIVSDIVFIVYIYETNIQFGTLYKLFIKLIKIVCAIRWLCYTFFNLLGGDIIFEQMMHLESDRLSDVISDLDSQIKDMPNGNFYVTQCGRYMRWFVSDNDGNRKYIPKKEKDIALIMAHKKYLEYLKADVQFDKDCIDMYLEKSKSYSRKIPELLENPKYMELLRAERGCVTEKLQEWSNSPYEKNEYSPESLIFHAASGHVVRSKSESLIAAELFWNKVPFRYECILNLGDRVVFPDFTIRHPSTGDYFFWEHFGMMDNPDYARKTSDKICMYISHNIIPSINLITTYETKNCPLNPLKVANIVKEYFL